MFGIRPIVIAPIIVPAIIFVCDDQAKKLVPWTGKRKGPPVAS